MSKIFGKLPGGERLERMLQTPTCKDGIFYNLAETNMVFTPKTMVDTIQQGVTTKEKSPARPLPGLRTDLIKHRTDTPSVIWFGHSSYLIHYDGKNILVDPVFHNASPIPFTVTPFKHNVPYKAEDMPDIDLLVITHDHYDHLDYKTFVKIKDRVKHIVCQLGAGEHFEYWGYDKGRITELYWWEKAEVMPGVFFTSQPTRHFAGRSLKRNSSLWGAYVLQIPGYQLYLGGDSGYGSHFKKTGDEFGPFDLAILECGQYNVNWHAIHMMPEETVQAAVDLQAKVLLPVHWGKFRLSTHAWNESPTRALAEAQRLNVKLTSPMLGEAVELDKYYPEKPWWELV